ncbi:hypothetical protein [Haloarchaeobius sp. HRN-SO-5]|uniref:hypothetical protein n=1 Tax=Haloarchaeobius sp. HRN-SO-5 TaxID=3446118 RepID=UPI003EC055CA
MARNFTDEDRDKNVVTSEGHHVGTIDSVHDDRATVDRDDDEGLTDKVKDMLGWGDDDSNQIRNDHVDTIDDDEVRLRRSR